MHSELIRPAHLPALKRLRIDSLDLGENEYISVDDWKAHLDIPIRWHLLTIKDMLQGNPESIGGKCSGLVEAGVATLVAEICVGTPRRNIKAFVEACRQFSRWTAD